MKFELAQPGTDPTSRDNPHPRGSLKEALPWVLGLLVFLAAGYWLFIRPKSETTTAAVTPVPPIAATVTTTPVPEPTATMEPAATPTLQPTATAVPAVVAVPSQGLTITYGVFVNGAQMACWCAVDSPGLFGPGAECAAYGLPVSCDPSRGTP